MGKLINAVIANRKNIMRASYFIAALAVIIIFVPKEGRFQYEYQKGKPWMHEDLVAQFDFPLYKTDIELMSEKSQILKDFSPIFRKDTLVKSSAISQFNADFRKVTAEYVINMDKSKILPKKFNGIFESYAKIANGALRYVYSNGIVDKTEEVYMNNKSNISVLLNNEAYDYDFDNVFTRRSAASYVSNIIRQEAVMVNSELMVLWTKLDVNKYIYPNLLYDNYITQKYKNELIANVSVSKGMIQAGERIISKGEMVTSEQYQVIDSMRKEYQQSLGERNGLVVLLGDVFIVAAVLLMLFLFFNGYWSDVLLNHRKLLFILSLIVFMVVVPNIIVSNSNISIYVIPFVIVPILVKTFFDSRIALFVHLITIFLVGLFVPNSFEFVFLNFIAGVVAIITLTNYYRRGRLFITVSLVYLAYVVLYVSLTSIEEGTPFAVNPYIFLWFLVNALLLMASYQLVYVLEKLFGFLSDATLIELCDTNMEQLLKLAEVAPGTFQHSLQVANLAQSAAYKVDANPLLVRAGALYHDIGKMCSPMYFTENQPTDFNPHNNIEPEESAAIIINHVIEGVNYAHKSRLPEPIVQFIRSHHGTSPVRYFLHMYKEKHEVDEASLAKFHYHGPIPSTKEQALVMMADSIEAASRSMTEINEESISNLVETIIKVQFDEGQFNNADITFKDIAIVKAEFKRKLANIYHARIAYPTESNK